MKREQIEFLSLRRWPMVVDIEQASFISGFTSEEITILTAAGLIKVLGGAKKNEKKLLATSEVQRLEDPEFASRCRRCVIEHWRNKNDSRSQKSSDSTNEKAARIATLNGAKHGRAS